MHCVKCQSPWKRMSCNEPEQGLEDILWGGGVMPPLVLSVFTPTGGRVTSGCIFEAIKGKQIEELLKGALSEVPN